MNDSNDLKCSEILQLWWVRSIWNVANCKKKWCTKHPWKGCKFIMILLVFIQHQIGSVFTKSKAFEQKCRKHWTQWNLFKKALGDVVEANKEDAKLLALIPSPTSSTLDRVLMNTLE